MGKFISFVVVSFLFLCIFGGTSIAQNSRKSVSAAEATGTFRFEFTGKYKGTANEIKILPLGKGKLKVSFDLVYPYYAADNLLTANLGQAQGEATIVADQAVYANDEYGECRITIKFVKPGMIKVTEENGSACGFGHNVSAAGTYKKTSKLKPKFEDLDQ